MKPVLTTFAASAGLALAVCATPALASGESLLLGKWCGTPDNPNYTNYRFTRDQLIVTHMPNGPTKAFDIVRYQLVRRGYVRVHYMGSRSNSDGGTPGDSANYHADFSNFGNGSMVQQPGVAPAYVFSRCR